MQLERMEGELVRLNRFEDLAKMNIRQKKKQIKQKLREHRNEQIIKLQ